MIPLQEIWVINQCNMEAQQPTAVAIVWGRASAALQKLAVGETWIADGDWL